EHGYSRFAVKGPAGRGRARTLSQRLLILRALFRSKRSKFIPARTGSDRVRAVDEQVLNGETPCQIITQRPHTITLGGVMSGSDETHRVFPRTVEGLLGGFTGQVQIDTGGDGLIDIALAATRAPANSPDQALPLDQQRLTPQYMLDETGEIAVIHGLRQRADVVDGEWIFRHG